MCICHVLSKNWVHYNAIIPKRLMRGMIFNRFSCPCVVMDVLTDVCVDEVIEILVGVVIVTLSGVQVDVIMDVVLDVGVGVLPNLNVNILGVAVTVLKLAMSASFEESVSFC